MLNENKSNTQKESFGQELKKIKVDVTAKDRVDAQKLLGIKSHTTISSYLNGNIKDIDTAAKLLVFFRGCINKRERILAGRSEK